MVCQAGDRPALLVNAQEQGDFCGLLQKGIVGGNLLRAIQVCGELDDASNRVCFKNLPDGGFHLGHLLLGDGIHGGFDLRKPQSARGHHKQLPHFFFQSHGFQLQNQGVRLCGSLRRLCGGGLGWGFCFPGLRLGGFRGRGQGNAAGKQGEGEKQGGKGQDFFHGSASFGENVNKGTAPKGAAFREIAVFSRRVGKKLDNGFLRCYF